MATKLLARMMQRIETLVQGYDVELVEYRGLLLLPSTIHPSSRATLTRRGVTSLIVDLLESLTLQHFTW